MNINMDTKLKYILLFLLVLIIIWFNNYTKIKEVDGFQNDSNNNIKWSDDLIRRFNIFQTTVNMNNNQYDLDILQQQATPAEAEELLATGYWPWPNDLKYLYMDKIWSSPIIKVQPQYALDYAMKLYNKNAATQLLAWNTKEGQFLLYGGDLGVTPEMPPNVHNTLKCSIDETTGDSVMEKTVYTGMDFKNGYLNIKKDKITNENIPNEMAGFSFLNGPCNPCGPLNLNPDFSCPFKLNVKGDDQMSSEWKTLWRV